MIEQLILFGIIIALMVYHYLSMKQAKEERQELMNAIVAKNSQEYRDLKVADNTKIKIEPIKDPLDDVVPMENLSVEEHFKQVMKQNEERTEE